MNAAPTAASVVRTAVKKGSAYRLWRSKTDHSRKDKNSIVGFATTKKKKHRICSVEI